MVRCAAIFFNILWLVSCLPRWLLFAAGTRRWICAQKNLRRRILKEARACRYASSGQQWEDLRVVSYEDLAPDIARIMQGEKGILCHEEVTLLEPTSGSSSATKFIPYTRGLQRQFRCAIDPWVFSTLLRAPGVLTGRHYWAISPNSAPPPAPSTVRIGFAHDADYLSPLARFAALSLLAVPAAAARITEGEAFRYVSLLFLLRSADLALVSVWSPSFFLALLEPAAHRVRELLADIERGGICTEIKFDQALRQELESFLPPLPGRARELDRIFAGAAAQPLSKGGRYLNWSRVWPRLRLISCWTDGAARECAEQVQSLFPGAKIQSKGLIATEGVITIPWGADEKKVLAYRSHYFEFEELNGIEQPESKACLCPAWKLEAGKRYSVIVSTAGGLYRYRLGDTVEVCGFHRSIPCLRFMGRTGIVADLAGEKLSDAHVASILDGIKDRWPSRFALLLLAPNPKGAPRGYTLYCEAADEIEPDELCRALEEKLQENYHYRHARAAGQLNAVRLFAVERGSGLAAYMRHEEKKGRRPGAVKPPALSTESVWSAVFRADGEPTRTLEEAGMQCTLGTARE